MIKLTKMYSMYYVLIIYVVIFNERCSKYLFETMPENDNGFFVSKKTSG